MSDDAKGKLLILACPLIWSLSGIFAKAIPWPGLCLASWRALLTAFSMCLFMRLRKVPITINRRSLAIGLTVPLTIIPYFMALKRTTAGSAIALQYMMPVFLLILSALFLGKRYRRGDRLVVLFAFGGALLLFLDGSANSSLWGNLLALFSGFAFSLTYLFMTDQPTAVCISGLMLGNALAGLGVFSVNPLALERTPAILAAVLFAGLFQVSIPNTVMGYAVRLTTPLACSLICMLEIVLSPLWVFLFQGELPGPLSLGGIALILATLVLWSLWDAKHREVTAQ